MAEDKSRRKAGPRDFIANDLTLKEAEALTDNPDVQRWLKELYAKGYYVASETGPSVEPREPYGG